MRDTVRFERGFTSRSNKAAAAATTTAAPNTYHRLSPNAEDNEDAARSQVGNAGYRHVASMDPHLDGYITDYNSNCGADERTRRRDKDHGIESCEMHDAEPKAKDEVEARFGSQRMMLPGVQTMRSLPFLYNTLMQNVNVNNLNQVAAPGGFIETMLNQMYFEVASVLGVNGVPSMHIQTISYTISGLLTIATIYRPVVLMFMNFIYKLLMINPYFMGPIIQRILRPFRSNATAVHQYIINRLHELADTSPAQITTSLQASYQSLYDYVRRSYVNNNAPENTDVDVSEPQSLTTQVDRNENAVLEHSHHQDAATNLGEQRTPARTDDMSMHFLRPAFLAGVIPENTAPFHDLFVHTTHAHPPPLPQIPQTSPPPLSALDDAQSHTSAWWTMPPIANQLPIFPTGQFGVMSTMGSLLTPGVFAPFAQRLFTPLNEPIVNSPQLNALGAPPPPPDMTRTNPPRPNAIPVNSPPPNTIPNDATQPDAAIPTDATQPDAAIPTDATQPDAAIPTDATQPDAPIPTDATQPDAPIPTDATQRDAVDAQQPQQNSTPWNRDWMHDNVLKPVRNSVLSATAGAVASHVLGRFFNKWKNNCNCSCNHTHYHNDKHTHHHTHTHTHTHNSTPTSAKSAQEQASTQHQEQHVQPSLISRNRPHSLPGETRYGRSKRSVVELSLLHHTPHT